jgi:hypothetical protein
MKLQDRELTLSRLATKLVFLLDDFNGRMQFLHGYGSLIVRYRGTEAEVQRRQLRMFIADIIPKV